MTDRRRRTWRPRHTWLVLLIGVVAVAAAAVVGLRLARASDDDTSMTSGSCTGAKYAFRVMRDDRGAAARLTITTSRPAQPWAVRITRGADQDGAVLVDRTTTSDENAGIEVPVRLATDGGPVEVRAAIKRPGQAMCAIEVALA